MRYEIARCASGNASVRADHGRVAGELAPLLGRCGSASRPQLVVRGRDRLAPLVVAAAVLIAAASVVAPATVVTAAA